MYDYVKPSNDAPERRALVARLVSRMSAHESWVGETHIQKSMFFMQHLLGVGTDYRFVMYQYGPYSFDVNDVLFWMNCRGELGYQWHQPINRKQYGPTLELRPRGRQLLDSNEVYLPQIEWVSEHIATKNVRELERVSTASLLISEQPEWSDREITLEMQRLKPHLTEIDTKRGIDESRRLRDRALSDGVILSGTPVGAA